MILSVLATLAFAALGMLPGWIVIRRQELPPGSAFAAMTVSLTLASLGTALLGALWHAISGGQLPASAIALVSLVMAGLAWARSRRLETASVRSAGERALELESLLAGVVFCSFGLISLALAVVSTPEGDLLVNKWYNADWFKHIGHVHALANFGVPARDIFGDAMPLYYYWLPYVLPGAGTAIGGEAWSALATANTIISALFVGTFYGIIRMVVRRKWAFALLLLAIVVFAPLETFVDLLTGQTMQELLNSPYEPSGPVFLSLPQFIPQHTLAVTILLSWALLAADREAGAGTITRTAALVALASVITVSTLFALVLLIAYGLTEIARRREKAIAELTIMVLLVAALAVIIGVVQIANPDSALDSPLFSNPADPNPWYLRAGTGILTVFGFCGAPSVVAIFAARRWEPLDTSERFAKTFAICLLIASVAVIAASQIFAPPRIAIELLIRSAISISIAATILGAWAIPKAWRSGGKARIELSLVIVLLLLVAAPNIYLRTAWLNNFTPGHFTRVPAVDREIMAELRAASLPGDRVWQYPEPPALARDGGGDNWSAIFAGRTVPNSERATDFTRAGPSIELSRMFFAGQDVAIPPAMDWVYASRILEPSGYDAVVERLSSDPEWTRRECYDDACLFERVKRRP